MRLQKLLAANQSLATVYPLKDVWHAPSVREGWRAGEAGCGMPGTAVPATALRPQPARIGPGHSRLCLLPHTGVVLEDVSKRIKAIKRMACGSRDSAYFFLKIKAAFPGKAR